MKKVIAIDGPSGAGKSTVAKLLAKDLGFDYLDTGALYRAVALDLLEQRFKESASDEELASVLAKTKVKFAGGRILLNGRDVSQEIRSPEASHYASVFSARIPVRQYLMGIQRDAALYSDLVAEGRDMTTVVFPDAYRKFYIDASVDERTKRRTLELLAKGFEVNEEQIKLDIIERDARDSGRDIAPLKKAEDAFSIDSTGLSIRDVFEKIAGIVKGKRKDKTGKKRNTLKVLTAKRSGFCFGVKRAIDITFDIAGKDPQGVFTLGPIIHNPQVIRKLQESGVSPIEVGSLNERDIRSLIIRTHGIPRQLYDSISTYGFTIIDATCPFVKKAQHYAKLLQESGYQVVILGDREHPEVKGLMSYAGDDVVVVDENTPPQRLKSKVGVVVQTTQPVEALKKVLSIIIEQAKEIKVYNTICNSTALRLKETEEMAGKVDVMIVVGGKNSANTTQLANLCRSHSVTTYHIETASEIEAGWFDKAKRVGITAGASTPEWIISEVEKRIRDIGGESFNGN